MPSNSHTHLKDFSSRTYCYFSCHTYPSISAVTPTPVFQRSHLPQYFSSNTYLFSSNSHTYHQHSCSYTYLHQSLHPPAANKQLQVLLPCQQQSALPLALQQPLFHPKINLQPHLPLVIMKPRFQDSLRFLLLLH